MILPVDEQWVKVPIKVSVSNQFFGWIFGLGEGVKITGPQEVVQKMQKQLRKLSELYP